MEECPLKEDKELCILYSSKLMDLIMKKYTYSILVILDKHGKLRFNELQRKISGMTQRALSIRLKELENAKLIKREVDQTSPVKVFYSITIKGKAVKNTIQILVSLVNLLDNEKDSYLC